MKYLFRPLTHKMIDHLEKGRAIELAATGRNFCTSDDFKGTLQGLYRRGFIKTKWAYFDGKELLRVNITEDGVRFLNRHAKDEKKIKEQIQYPVNIRYTSETN